MNGLLAALRAPDPARALVDHGFAPEQALDMLGDPHPVTRRLERCRWCSSALQGVAWAEVTALGEVERRYVLCRGDCPTPDCGPCCPTCKRKVGDIHSGACISVLSKLADPCRVSREDCYGAPA
jgi:hypothetical protein